MSESFDWALRKAIAFLAKSDHFEMEVRKHLHTFDGETVDAVVSRLRSKGILNDCNAANRFVASRSGRKAVGSLKLKQGLEQRGASLETISSALDGRDEKAHALEALNGKFTPDFSGRGKGYRFLLSRGFDCEVSAEVVDEFFKNNVDID